MLEKIKKLGIGYFISLGALVLILISMFLSIASSSNLGFSIDELPLIIVFSILAILCIIGSGFLTLKFKNNPLSYLPLLVAAVLAGVCFIYVINSRTYLMGTLWFTKLDQSNQYAVAAMNTGAPAFIMYFLSMIILTVASFFNLFNTKAVETKAEETTNA